AANAGQQHAGRVVDVLGVQPADPEVDVVPAFQVEAEHLDDLRPHVAEAAAARFGLPRDDAGGLDEPAEPLLAEPKRLLRALALGDVADERAEVQPLAYLDGADRDLDLELVAVAAQRVELGAAVQQRRLARFDEAAESGAVRVAVAFGHDEVGDLTAERLLARPAEHLLGGRVPVDDAAALVDGDDGVEGGVDDQASRFLAGGAQ